MKKETATAHIKVYPSTLRSLKVKAAKQNITIAQLVAEQNKEPRASVSVSATDLSTRQKEKSGV